jgi:hypothetical protein
MAKKHQKMNTNIKCPLSGKACINCSLYRGRHFNQCFQDHYRGDNRKGTGPLISMGYLATGRIVKCDQCATGYVLADS